MQTTKQYVKSKEPLANFRAHNSSDVVNFLRKESDEWITRLTHEEKRLIQKYCYNHLAPQEKGEEAFYARLNQILRKGEIEKDPKLKAYAETISRALNKFNLEDDIICYRSTDQDYYPTAKIGDVLNISQFVSTSVTKHGSLKRPYNIIIYVKAGILELTWKK